MRSIGMTSWRMLQALLLCSMLVPAWAQSPSQLETPLPPTAVEIEPGRAALKPGEFLWHPEIAPEGPVVLVISLDEQLAFVYRNGIAIGVSTISSGKPGKETPTGVFTILQKKKEHYSNLYNNAPMPYMQRLTWDGIALHGGSLPGYPASHGCVRLPQPFAEKVYSVTRGGDTVVVANAKASPASLVHPAVLAPINREGLPIALNELDDHFWDDSLSPEGPLSVLVSLADQRVFVLRNGVTIGEALLQVAPDFAIHGSVLLVMGTETEPVPSLLDPAHDRHRWSAYPILGEQADSLAMLQLLWQNQVMKVDEIFARQLYQALTPGATVLLTDMPAIRGATGMRAVQPVLESDAPEPVPVSGG